MIWVTTDGDIESGQSHTGPPDHSRDVLWRRSVRRWRSSEIEMSARYWLMAMVADLVDRSLASIVVRVSGSGGHVDSDDHWPPVHGVGRIASS